MTSAFTNELRKVCSNADVHQKIGRVEVSGSHIESVRKWLLGLGFWYFFNKIMEILIPNRRDDLPSNLIKTSKYNIINFLPKALLLQFLRIANIYFLVTAVL